MHSLDLDEPLARAGGVRGWWASLRAAIEGWSREPAAYRMAVSNPLTRPFVDRRTRQVFDLMAGFVHSQVLLTCVRAGVLRHLQAQPATLQELARTLDWPEEGLQRLLASALSLELLAQRRDGRYTLGALGAPVMQHPGIAAMVEHNHLLYEDLRDPEAFLRRDADGRLAGYWPYARADGAPAPDEAPPQSVARYSALMAESQTFVIDEILRSHDFRGHRQVLDVGAGKGRFLAALAARYPALRLQAFDLPPVLALAQASHQAAGIAGRVQYHPGNFFADALPLGADLITLVRVAHDHSDAAVAKLLAKACASLPAGGQLLLAEPMAQEPGGPAHGDAYFHYYLKGMGSGRLRTPAHLTRLLQQAGFGPVRRLRGALPIHAQVLIAVKDRG